jgi:hypothetical protein
MSKKVDFDPFDFGTKTESPVSTVIVSEETATKNLEKANSTETIDTTEEEEETATVVPTVVKRGRGRPRKVISNTVGEVQPKTSATKKEKEPEVVLSPKEAFIQSVLSKAGIVKVPSLESLFEGFRTDLGKIEISEIGLFIGTPKDELLKDIQKDISKINSINLSTEVSLKLVQEVGIEIMRDGKIYSPIQVAKITEDGTIQCTSGRHRLAFLAIMYGTDIEVPILESELSHSDARKNVMNSNQSRRALGLEKSEFAILDATNGDLSGNRDDMYKQVVTKKTKAVDFCVYSVFDAHAYGTKIHFDVAMGTSRKDGLTTVNNLKCYWRNAIKWHDETSRKDFDEQLKASISFLNDLVAECKKHKEFTPSQQLSTMSLAALGSVFRTQTDAGNDPSKIVEKISNALLKIDGSGRQKKEKTYDDLTKAILA